ncbi:general substrate transporter [Lophiotrema nucula]|uniref:General substrate transporter n=1 Tax=Lophiotrema nucula TaxID=690887 RepID=A0A6A5ZJJ3_9PLEO|nr:general substrate transporter [Lophiotrema nucula]
MGTPLGNVRAFFLAGVCCIGSFLFAYDTGIIGGILVLPSFQKDFRYSNAAKTNVNSNSNSLLQAGAFFSCFFIWPFTARYGRRWSIALASLIFCIGAIIQTINTHHIAAFYVARVISGVGVGMATVMIPMYSAEMAPKHIRGRMGSMFQFFFTLGVMTSYWVTYAVSVHIKPSSRQWQIPIGLQLVPGGLLGLGMLFLKESVRFLAKKGRNEEALESLIWIRGGDSEEVREEMDQIIAGVEAEHLQTEGFKWKEVIQPANRYRLFITVTIQIGVQLTGNTSLAYYAPQVFAAVGAGDSKLLITGFFGVVKVVACGLFLIFLVDRIGRRWALMSGAFVMGSCMLIIALITKTHPPSATGGIKPAGVASITMIYLEAMAYNSSWGPVPWLYMGEIFNTRFREAGIAIGTATQWLFNFAFSQITPHAVANLGWRTFLMFCIFNWSLVFYAYFFVKETAKKSLEEMDALFAAKGANPDIAALEDAKLGPRRINSQDGTQTPEHSLHNGR